MSSNPGAIMGRAALPIANRPSEAPRVRGLETLVGNTPMLAIHLTLRGRPRLVFAKSENLNMTGSIKDRMALHILLEGYRRGQLRPGGLIIEATSGNTGISFAALGRALGHPVAIFMPDWMSAERINLIRSFGATVRLVSAAEGGFRGSIALADQLAAATPGAFLPHQFSNQDNCAAHERTTGPEIVSQMYHQQRTPNGFVAGVGTGGTIMGVGRFLRTLDPAVRLFPVEPASSPTLTTGHKVGSHRIQGISDEFIPPIVDLGFLDQVLAIDDGDAIVMAQRLARELGLAVGISAGANFLGAVLASERLGPAASVVTVFPDSNKKYLSTDLLREEPVKPGFMTPEIELKSAEAFRRVCITC